MGIVIWFIVGLVLAAGISYGALYLYRLKSSKEAPLPPEKLPKDWDSVMPRSKAKAQGKSQSNSGPSFRKVGVKKGSGGGIPGKRF